MLYFFTKFKTTKGTAMIKEINVQELIDLQKSQDITLIDVREPSEYQPESIKGAINIPLSTVSIQTIQPYLLDTADTIVFQCRSGKRSMVACEILANENISKKLINLKGGILAWVAEGYKVLNSTDKS